MRHIYTIKKMKLSKYIIAFTLLAGCKSKRELQEFGLLYQQHRDYKSLQKVVELLPANADTLLVKEILGQPNDMGFEYRYTIDSAGANGCIIGAIFKMDDKGEITQKWIDEICE
jgi:hypothetical protein